MTPPPPIGSDLSRPAGTWKKPPLGAPLGVWIGVGLFVAVPVLVVVAIVQLVEPASDAAFTTFEEDETGFFPFIAALFSVFLLIVAVVGAGVVLLIIAVAVMVLSGFARRKPS